MTLVGTEDGLLDHRKRDFYSFQNKSTRVVFREISHDNKDLYYYLLFEGDPGNIVVVEKPTCIQDVQIGEMDFGDVLDDNIEEIPSIAIILNHGTFRRMILAKESIEHKMRKARSYLA
ncbi:hypothetical protein GCM10027570_33140 [Streptomonospora sediminis]